MGQQQCCGKAPTHYETVSADQLPYERFSSESGGSASRGVAIWVDSVEDLIVACSLEDPAGLEHLYTLTDSERVAHSVELSSGEDLYLPRDVGVRCADPWDLINAVGLSIPWLNDDMQKVQNSYLCLQIDDLANPWGAYAVAEGRGPDAHYTSAKLVSELPSLLARHPQVYSSPCQALYECQVVADKLVNGNALYGASSSTLTTAILRDGYLNIAWLGDSRIVLGRLAAKQAEVPRKSAATIAAQNGLLKSVPRRRPGQTGRHQEVYSNAQNIKQWINYDGPPPILRAVDLTADAATAAGSSSQGVPEVRRMRLKADDVCVVMGTGTLWKWLTPEEVVTIVGQNMHRMASDAADAIAAEVRKRMGQPSADDTGEELTLIVLYLAGENYVKEFDILRATHLEGTPFISESLVSVADVGGTQKCCAVPFVG